MGINIRSDVEAKRAFVAMLLNEGFDEARVTGTPADVTAVRNGQIYYFEIKYTIQEDEYFGAATLTEWEAALTFEDHFWFVVASKPGPSWVFRRFTPGEFMTYCSIPPFKIFFHIVWLRMPSPSVVAPPGRFS